MYSLAQSLAITEQRTQSSPLVWNPANLKLLMPAPGPKFYSSPDEVMELCKELVPHIVGHTPDFTVLVENGRVTFPAAFVAAAKTVTKRPAVTTVSTDAGRHAIASVVERGQGLSQVRGQPQRFTRDAADVVITQQDSFTGFYRCIALPSDPRDHSNSVIGASPYPAQGWLPYVCVKPTH
eukprot:TRINITY_DN2919_c0_g1_i2.p1 TRINITY_DN2919_c0_g1~~TRINITY_DN2919_c0_g1_i2.p1  ORF type:complete len:180 (-),score=16.79 TRINITY_DN2919_c0_g1_i2:209-748(-)